MCVGKKRKWSEEKEIKEKNKDFQKRDNAKYNLILQGSYYCKTSQTLFMTLILIFLCLMLFFFSFLTFSHLPILTRFLPLLCVFVCVDISRQPPPAWLYLLLLPRLPFLLPTFALYPPPPPCLPTFSSSTISRQRLYQVGWGRGRGPIDSTISST